MATCSRNSSTHWLLEGSAPDTAAAAAVQSSSRSPISPISLAPACRATSRSSAKRVLWSSNLARSIAPMQEPLHPRGQWTCSAPKAARGTDSQAVRAFLGPIAGCDKPRLAVPQSKSLRGGHGRGGVGPCLLGQDGRNGAHRGLRSPAWPSPGPTTIVRRHPPQRSQGFRIGGSRRSEIMVVMVKVSESGA